MFKKLLRTFTALLLISSIMAMNVFADDVTDLQKQKNQKQNEIDKIEDDLAYIMLQMDELEVLMAEKNDEVQKANKELEVKQKELDAQYSDMKLRIKYMYEDQTVSISDVLLSSSNMSEVLNKSEYVQQVYSYDRAKLDEMSIMASKVKEIKTKLEDDMKQLESMDAELHDKQASLYTTIEDLKKEMSDITKALTNAQQKAARAISNSYSLNYSTTANNNSEVANGVVNLAYQYIGTPYAYGGSSPSGFDCSGFTSFLFAQYGIGLSRSSSAQAYGGQGVSLSEIQPGDVICYPGHVGLYIGNGQIIHASVPGDYVKVASMNVMTITAVRRYW